ncbi:MAG: hypothetical protein KAZ20_01045, partial [Sediminibacterium sp.]|nr:hypothetical protein [Sediminibacterium sp.]
MKKTILILFWMVLVQYSVGAQSNALIEKVSAKLNIVNDYVATGVMKTDVAFIKASLGKVKV